MTPQTIINDRKKCVQRASWLYTISRRKKSVFVWSQRRVLRVMISMTRLLDMTQLDNSNQLTTIFFFQFLWEFLQMLAETKGMERFPLWDFCGFSWNLRWSPSWWFTDSYLKKLTRKLRLASCDELNPSVTSKPTIFQVHDAFRVLHCCVDFFWKSRMNGSREPVAPDDSFIDFSWWNFWFLFNLLLLHCKPVEQCIETRRVNLAQKGSWKSGKTSSKDRWECTPPTM